MRRKLLPGNQNGVSMIVMTLAMVILLSSSAMVVDVGRVLIEKDKLQTAVDASAIAAAYELPDTAKALEAARHYAQLNGVDPDDIEVVFSDGNRTVDVKAKKTVEFTLAKVIGIDSADTSTFAAAMLDSIGGPFNYALFSGSDTASLNINGSGTYIEGSTHSNKNFASNGSNLTITGSCEACTTVTTNGSNISIGTKVPNSPYVEMPDFSETLRLQAEAAGQLYIGDKTFNSSNISLDTPIYIDGDVTVNGSRFKGKGCIIATGNITFNGSNLNNSTDDAVCFYSKNGDITVNGSNAVLEGMLYAPSGSIRMNGSHQTIHGRVIGKTLTFNGSGLNIIGGTTELESLPSYGIKLIR